MEQGQWFTPKLYIYSNNIVKGFAEDAIIIKTFFMGFFCFVFLKPVL